MYKLNSVGRRHLKPTNAVYPAGINQ